MDITIDTTHPLNDRDRAILRALLDGEKPSPAAPQVTVNNGPRPNSAAAIAGNITGALPRRGDSQAASARGPVATQPGVRVTESTTDDAPTEPGSAPG